MRKNYNLIQEMARVGYIDSFEIYIKTDDPGNIPHFHFFNSKSDTITERIGGCIQFEKAEYFVHGPYKATLNIKQKRNLVKFLNAPDTEFPQLSNWQILISEWNRNNSKKRLPIDLQMPDYNML